MWQALRVSEKEPGASRDRKAVGFVAESMVHLNAATKGKYGIQLSSVCRLRRTHQTQNTLLVACLTFSHAG
jgi:hypothetical protein